MMPDVGEAMDAVSTRFGRFLTVHSEVSSDTNFAELEARREAVRRFTRLDIPFEIDDIKFSDLVLLARNGDAKADACLRAAAAMHLENGQAVPDILAQYAAEALCAGIPRPRRHRMQNGMRDVNIAICVKTVQLMGFLPTRNASLHGRDDCRLSACAIVSRALEGLNVHISEKGIEKIWGKFASFREHIPPYDAKRN